jgi:hypothetical protein
MQGQTYLDEYLHLLYLDSMLTEEQLQESFLDIDRIRNSFEKNITKAHAFLRKYNVTPSDIKKHASKSYGRIKGMIQRRESPELIAQAISDSAFGWIDETLKNIIDVERVREKPIAAAIGMTLVVSVLNGLFALFFGSFFGFGIGMNIVAIVVAPFLEEALKRVAVLSGKPFLVTGIFAGIEAIDYVVRLTLMGMSLPKVILLRGIGIMLHFGTMLIQKYFVKKSVETGESYKSDTGYFLAVAVHSLFNIVATVANASIGKWALK